MPLARAAAEVAANHSADIVAVADRAADRPGGDGRPGNVATRPPGRFNIDRVLADYISSVFYKATMGGIPGLSMLLPYASAYGNRRIVITPTRTYTSGMMRQLMADIGDTATEQAWEQVHELDALLAKGPLPGVATHCLYGM